MKIEKIMSLGDQPIKATKQNLNITKKISYLVHFFFASCYYYISYLVHFFVGRTYLLHLSAVILKSI